MGLPPETILVVSPARLDLAAAIDLEPLIIIIVTYTLFLNYLRSNPFFLKVCKDVNNFKYLGDHFDFYRGMTNIIGQLKIGYFIVVNVFSLI